LEVRTSKAATFAVNLRIPAWAEGASVSVNGKRETVAAGTFARVQREWKSGDRVEVELPLKMQVEAVDAQHTDTVALVTGPLVLFAITDSQPSVTRAQLLAAKKSGAQSWQVETASGTLKMLPWTEIEDKAYTTYLRVNDEHGG
jgi:DUF1680 family protein